MQVIGFEADADALHAFGESLSGRIAELTAEIYQQAGEEFNINSTKKLGEILFDKLQLPVIKKTKRGYSTNIEVLEALRGYHAIADLLIEYRQLTKLQSTYVDGLLKVIDPADRRIHSTFQQMVTATGRLSSTDPNLQNIPVRQELGSELRHMFRAKEGCVLADADYSQIELRVLAHIAQDKTMIEAFRSDTDIHAVTASQVFRCKPEEVTPLMRRSAKAVNFGIVYGISSFSLAKDINVTVKQAGEYIDNYLETYHGVRDYMQRIKEEARENGYVSTLFGRRRYLPELKSKNFNIRSFGERVALNTPIQGTAADIIKIAMVRVSRRLKQENLRSRLILQVHDELILEVPEEEQEQAQRILVEEMEQAYTLAVPLRVDAACGKDWYAAKG
jgi:DNA polymerase-1